MEPKQGQSGTRYKILVSDGQQASSCILASQLAHLAATGEVREGTIVDIHECLANQMNNKRYAPKYKLLFHAVIAQLCLIISCAIER